MPSPERIVRGVRDWVPRWWRGEGGRLGRGLDLVTWPAELLFRAGVTARNRSYDLGFRRIQSAPIPVVSVGNIGVGGAGKTPFAAWVAARLAEWGKRPGMALSGYGADEILVHREINPHVPVFTARRRIDAVAEAARNGCDVAVLDDAFQHRSLARDLDIVLLAADGWTGANRLLPRGPWREGLDAIARADLVVLTRKAAQEAVMSQLEGLVTARVGEHRLVRCHLVPGRFVPLGSEGAGERGGATPPAQHILAVTSLADPAPFVAQLASLGAVVELASYPDHHSFDPQEAADLTRRAGERPLVMTRKEAVKLRELLPAHVDAWMMEQEVVIERGESLLEAALRNASNR